MCRSQKIKIFKTKAAMKIMLSKQTGLERRLIDYTQTYMQTKHSHTK